MSQTPPNGTPRHLVRGLTLVPATALIVTNVIGSGVFLKARVMTCNVGTPSLVLLAYVVAGIFTLAGSLTFAELSTVGPGDFIHVPPGAIHRDVNPSDTEPREVLLFLRGSGLVVVNVDGPEAPA